MPDHVIKSNAMSKGNSLLCFLAGAAAGAFAALLLAPDSGENTRTRIRHGASEFAGKARGKIDESLEIIENALEEK